jgi:hypothetical protein
MSASELGGVGEGVALPIAHNPSPLRLSSELPSLAASPKGEAGVL